LRFDPEAQDLILSVKEALGDPWENVERTSQLVQKLRNCSKYNGLWRFCGISTWSRGLSSARYVSWKRFKDINEL